jgi:hypothetical protein
LKTGIEPVPGAAVLELVIDDSGSMEYTAPNTNGQTKWAISAPALASAIDALPAVVSAGLLFFPNMSSARSDVTRPITACVNTDAAIPIAPLDTTQRALLAQAIGAAGPTTLTPTFDAYDYALRGSPGSLVPTATPAPKFMLLMTDGAPTLHSGCQGRGDQNNPEDPSEIVADIQLANDTYGIKTFVIGVPGSEGTNTGGGGPDQRPWLSLAAEVGGTALDGCNDSGNPYFCHMDMTQTTDFSESLSQGLAKVTGAVAKATGSCTYPIPATDPSGTPVDLGNITLIVQSHGSADGTLIYQDDQGACSVGWQLDATGHNVVLCPDTCAAVQADVTATVEVLYGCRVIGPVR